MKRFILAILVCVSMCIGVVGCGNEAVEETSSSERAASVSNSNLKEDSSVIAVGKTTVSYKEYKTYYYFMKNQYESILGTDIWKYNSINNSVNGSMRVPTDTGILLSEFTTGYMTSLGGSVAVQGYNKPSTTRQANDSEQNFKLNFNFSEVGNGIKNAITSTNLKNLAYAQNIDSFKMQEHENNGKSTAYFGIFVL